jgi:hypothetical protein
MYIAGLDRYAGSLGYGKAVVESYASISSTSEACWSSSALKRRAGIWLAGNLRVEVVAGCLYSPSCRRGSYLFALRSDPMASNELRSSGNGSLVGERASTPNILVAPAAWSCL